MRMRIPMLIAALAATLLTTLATGKDDSAEKVMKAFQKSCPTLAAGEEGTDTIEVDLSANFMGFDARAAYRRPGHYSLSLIDSRDGHPFILVRDGRALIYDPIAGRLFVTSRAAFRFALYVDDEGGMSFRMIPRLLRETAKEEDYDLRLDFGSVVGGLVGDLSVRPEEGDRYRLLGRTSRDTRIEVRVDPAGPYPVAGLTCRDPKGQVLFEFTKIVKNGELPMSRFVLPARERLAPVLKVTPLPDLTGGDTDAQVAAVLAMAIQGRAALGQPEARKGLPEGIDWDGIVKRDREDRKTLARLVAEAEKEATGK